MDDRLESIFRSIRELRNELSEELEKKRQEFLYDIQEKRVRFDEAVKAQHKQLSTNVFRYIFGAEIRHIVTVPVIWSCLLPALFLDLVVSFYQFVCFPLYGIPKVKRSHYIVVDRQYLAYLNIIEKINCAFCGYFNGVIIYVQEIAGRTEQYWCPIKHARTIGAFHNRYENFIDYGNGVRYREEFQEIRRRFNDLVENDSQDPKA